MQTNKNEVSKKALFSTRIVCFMGLMVALSIVLGKVLAFNIGDMIRFSLENLSIIFSGIALGPLGGLIVGVVSDLVGCLIVGYAINPYVTLGAALIGAVSGVAYKATSALSTLPRVIISVTLSHTVGSIFVKTIGLAEFYLQEEQMSFLTLLGYRTVAYVLISIIECTIIYFLIKSKSIKAQLTKLIGKEKSSKAKMDYNEALEYIHSVNWTFCKPGLERTELLCKELGDPQKSLKFIHVAGTNGKGSFSSMLQSVLTEAGYKTGLYTSPYIKCFNERMAIDGKMIDNDTLVRITERVKVVSDKMKDKPTEFELVTAIALVYFAESKCDYVVLECGLGGRLDSTNIVDTTVLSVITGISLDHTSILGNTTEEIAKEKAGIIKEGTPCLWCGELTSNNSGAFDVISQVAKEKKAPLYTVDRASIKVNDMSLEGTCFSYGEYENVKISLLGSYQIANATNVLCAVNILKNLGLEILNDKLYLGLEKAKWHARFEVISTTPLVIFDGGHNPEGVEAAIDSIKQYFGLDRVLILTGVMKDKDYFYVASKISEVSKKVFTVTPDNPRALNAEEYKEVFSSLGTDAQAFNSVKEAVITAYETARDENIPLISLGSLYMYSEVFSEIEKIKKEEK